MATAVMLPSFTKRTNLWVSFPKERQPGRRVGLDELPRSSEGSPVVSDEACDELVVCHCIDLADESDPLLRKFG